MMLPKLKRWVWALIFGFFILRYDLVFHFSFSIGCNFGGYFSGSSFFMCFRGVH